MCIRDSHDDARGFTGLLLSHTVAALSVVDAENHCGFQVFLDDIPGGKPFRVLIEFVDLEFGGVAVVDGGIGAAGSAAAGGRAVDAAVPRHGEKDGQGDDGDRAQAAQYADEDVGCLLYTSRCV